MTERTGGLYNLKSDSTPSCLSFLVVIETYSDIVSYLVSSHEYSLDYSVEVLFQNQNTTS